MKLTDIQAQLTANLGGEAATDVHSPEDRLRAINRAVTDIALDFDISERASLRAVPAYNLGLEITGAQYITSVTNTAGYPLTRIPLDRLLGLRSDEVVTYDEPEYYANDGTSLYLYPSPNELYSVVVRYAAPTGALSDPNDEPWDGLYPEFHKLVPTLAASYLWRERGATTENMQGSRFWLSEYSREKEALTRFQNRERGSTPQVLTFTHQSSRRRRRW